MTRNLELWRAILMRVEEAHAGQFVTGKELYGLDFPHAEIAEHVHLLERAGLIEASVSPNNAGRMSRFTSDSSATNHWGFAPVIRIVRLTNDGHDLIRNIRNESVWDQVVEAAKKHGGSLAIDVVVAIASRVARQLAGL